MPVSLQAAQRIVRHDAGAGEPEAGRQRLHGGFLRRRRHRRGAARTARTCCISTADGDRRDAWASGSPPTPTLGSTAPSSRNATKPLEPQGGLVALFGNLAPQGRDPQALGRRLQAVRASRAGRWCFTSLDDLAARIDDPKLDVEANDILVLQNAGPHSASAMPEAGYLPIPKKLAHQGRQGHGARLRRAHERHRLRHDRAARDAGLRPPAARSAWCATATASGSRSRSAASISWSTRRNSSAAPPRPSPRRNSRRAAMPGSTPRRSSAPTKAAISPS